MRQNVGLYLLVGCLLSVLLFGCAQPHGRDYTPGEWGKVSRELGNILEQH